MAFIHKKKIGKTTYYTLRISVREGSRVIAKDLANLGTDLSKIKIDVLEKQFSKEIRKSHKTIKKFLDSNYYIEQTKKTKKKKEEFLNKEQLYEIEATKTHYQKKFLKLDKKTQREIYEYFLIRFAVNSTAIEGNTITLKEATQLFLNEKTPKNKTIREIFDLTNTKKVFYELLKNKQKLSTELIVEIHDTLLDNIDERKGLRNHDIHIFGQPFKPTPARYVKEDLELLINWYKENKKKIQPIILATTFHHKFEQIHPFSDGNGRTGRMIANHILIQEKYPPIIIDKRDRIEYLEVMNKADKATKKNLTDINEKYKPLLKFIVEQLKKSYWDIFLF